MSDSILLSPMTVDGLNKIGVGDFNAVELPERMAWIVLLLRKMPDDPKQFPRGKWATIQHIEEQITRCVDAAVAEALAALADAPEEKL